MAEHTVVSGGARGMYTHADGSQETHEARNERLAGMLRDKLVALGMDEREAEIHGAALWVSLTEATS